jgi:hypothetical protein
MELIIEIIAPLDIHDLEFFLELLEFPLPGVVHYAIGPNVVSSGAERDEISVSDRSGSKPFHDQHRRYCWSGLNERCTNLRDVVSEVGTEIGVENVDDEADGFFQ